MPHFSNQSEENYLKAIFKLETKKIKKLNNAALAKDMELHPASVLQMARKLCELNLIQIGKDKSLSLTELGRIRAINTLRKHRLWEVFLVNKLKYNWTEVHELAEQLEHIESDDLINRLEAFLGNPVIDPHGDPIPEGNGKIKTIKTQPLSLIEKKKKVKLTKLENPSDNFLKYLDKIGLKIGDILEVSEIEDYDKSMIVMHKKNAITLTYEAASNLLVS